jgi:hypothetical protein
MSIPVEERFAELTGWARREVTCEGCGFEYLYVLSREGRGAGFSPFFLDRAGAAERAWDEAKADLVVELAAGIDPVPCPRCGHYQADMVALLREQRLFWMKWVAILAIPVGLIVVPTAIVALGDAPLLPVAKIVILAVIVGILPLLGSLPLVRIFLVRNYDPNAENAEARMVRGRARAVSREHFVQLQRQKQGTNVTEDRGGT